MIRNPAGSWTSKSGGGGRRGVETRPRSEMVRRGTSAPDSRMKWPKSGVFSILGYFGGRLATSDDSSTAHSQIRGDVPVQD